MNEITTIPLTKETQKKLRIIKAIKNCTSYDDLFEEFLIPYKDVLESTKN